jgi:hypothetical protein
VSNTPQLPVLGGEDFEEERRDALDYVTVEADDKGVEAVGNRS